MISGAGKSGGPRRAGAGHRDARRGLPREEKTSRRQRVTSPVDAGQIRQVRWLREKQMDLVPPYNEAATFFRVGWEAEYRAFSFLLEGPSARSAPSSSSSPVSPPRPKSARR